MKIVITINDGPANLVEAKMVFSPQLKKGMKDTPAMAVAGAAFKAIAEFMSANKANKATEGDGE